MGVMFGSGTLRRRSRSGRNYQPMAEINVTPFVDVMLVLLIIFMVTAPMMMQGVDVQLPEASSDPIAAEENLLVITVDRQQKVFINDFQVDVAFLGKKLQSILRGRTEKSVFLKADKEIPYGTVVRVMSEIKAAGVEKLGMVTDPLKQDADG